MQMVDTECGLKSVTPGCEFLLCTYDLHELKIFCFFINKIKYVQLKDQ